MDCFTTNSLISVGKKHVLPTLKFMFVIFGQLNTMRQKSSNSSILIAMIICNRQTEFVVNTCVTAPIMYIIDTFVSYRACILL